MKIGIISDTHNVLRNDVLEELQTCDYILHAGDIMKEEILEKLKKTYIILILNPNGYEIIQKDVQ